MTWRSVFPIVVALAGSVGLLPPAPSNLEWEFAPGRPTERLQAQAGDMPSRRTPVTLPHRVLAPNTALWYTREMPLADGSALEVDADDGAQVFVDGRRLGHYRRWFFVRGIGGGRHRVVIRVLNNAVEGGLWSVRDVEGAAVPPAPRGDVTPPDYHVVESDAFRARMPSADRPCAFTLWADSQGGWTTFGRIVERMAAEDAAFSAGVGDLVNDGSDPEQWPAFASILAPLMRRTAVVPIAGNHDHDGFYDDLQPALYRQWFRERTRPAWFAWSCGPARLVALDINHEFPVGISPGSEQQRWLEREVMSAAWRDAGWRILLVHQPPWSRSWAGYDGDEAVRRIVEPLARDRGLDLVVSGHSHAYEHLVRPVGPRPLHVLIVGGAGGGLEDAGAEALSAPLWRIAVRHHFVRAVADRDRLVFEAVDLTGRPFHRVEIPARTSAQAADRSGWFRGREPIVEPLLAERGLNKQAGS